MFHINHLGTSQLLEEGYTFCTVG